MSFNDFIRQNYIMLFELFGLLITLFISVHLPKKNKFYTKITIILLLITIIIHNTELAIQDLPYSTLYRHFLTAAKYTMYPIIIMTLILAITPFKNNISKKLKILFIAPEVIAIPFYFSSQWTKLVAYFNEYGEHLSSYESGPLIFLPYAIFCLYSAIFLLVNFITMRKFSFRKKFLSLYIPIGALSGFVLYMVFNISDDYTPIFTAALLLYYLLFYIHLSTIDTLTGLFNRQAYYQELEVRSSKFKGVISVDMNELKYLNDTYGHDAGDEALRTIANVLQNYAGESSIVYRVGGDEFVILYLNACDESLIVNISNMKDQLSKTKYSCAFGYSLNDKDIHSALIEADKMMYEDKKALKEEKEKNGEILHLR